MKYVRTFEVWFFKLYLPEASKKQGKKLLIGDNLSSHFSYDVIKVCEENNIAFVPLPPNATHLMQPLDVSFFAPAKRHWQKVLSGWRKESRRSGAIPKTQFPRLLRKLQDKLVNDGISTNLKKGFEACGLYPVNRQQVLKRIPQRNEDDSLDNSFLSDAIMDLLQQSNEKSDGKREGRK